MNVLLQYNQRADFRPDDVDDTFFRNAGSYKSHAASHPKRRHSLNILFYLILTFVYRRRKSLLRQLRMTDLKVELRGNVKVVTVLN
jgi:hypothetical protein